MEGTLLRDFTNSDSERQVDMSLLNSLALALFLLIATMGVCNILTKLR